MVTISPSNLIYFLFFDFTKLTQFLFVYYISPGICQLMV